MQKVTLEDIKKAQAEQNKVNPILLTVHSQRKEYFLKKKQLKVRLTYLYFDHMKEKQKVNHNKKNKLQKKIKKIISFFSRRSNG